MNTKLRLFEYYKKTNESNIYGITPRIIETKYGAPKAPESRISEAKACLREEDIDRKNGGRTAANKLLFGLDDMELLVTAYDGYTTLINELDRIFEIRPTGGCFSAIESIKTLIQKLSPLYIDGNASGEQELDRILDDISLSIDEVAEQLMGGI